MTENRGIPEWWPVSQGTWNWLLNVTFDLILPTVLTLSALWFVLWVVS